MEVKIMSTSGGAVNDLDSERWVLVIFCVLILVVIA